MTSPLKLLQSPTQAPSNALQHPDARNYVSLGNAVSIATDRRKGHANYPVLLGNLSDYVHPQRIRSVIEDDQDFIAIPDFPNCSDHIGKVSL